MESELDLGMDELLRVLQEVSLEEGGGLTARELSAETGWCRQKILDGLHTWNERGRLRVTRKRITKIDGNLAWAPAYSMKD